MKHNGDFKQTESYGWDDPSDILDKNKNLGNVQKNY